MTPELSGRLTSAVNRAGVAATLDERDVLIADLRLRAASGNQRGG